MTNKKDRKKYVYVSKNAILEAIPETNGYFSKLSAKLGCSVRTLARAYKKYPEVRAAIDDCREGWLDDAEAKMWDIALGKTEPSKHQVLGLMFTLKCQGKKRGWIDKEVVQVGGSVNVNFRWQGEEQKSRKIAGPLGRVAMGYKKDEKDGTDRDDNDSV